MTTPTFHLVRGLSSKRKWKLLHPLRGANGCQAIVFKYVLAIDPYNNCFSRFTMTQTVGLADYIQLLILVLLHRSKPLKWDPFVHSFKMLTWYSDVRVWYKKMIAHILANDTRDQNKQNRERMMFK